ncbi:hypothetical protein Q1695_004788 [Nippostrongylus brasiliensis]|nr:hypothetical protein Q1695_004788 [Nippostrongylus brasiliensis]
MCHRYYTITKSRFRCDLKTECIHEQVNAVRYISDDSVWVDSGGISNGCDQEARFPPMPSSYLEHFTFMVNVRHFFITGGDIQQDSGTSRGCRV